MNALDETVVAAGSEVEAAQQLELVRVRRSRRRSLPQEVANRLVELVASGGAPELVLPPERQLSEQLGVSRNVLREALSALDGLDVHRDTWQETSRDRSSRPSF